MAKLFLAFCISLILITVSLEMLYDNATSTYMDWDKYTDELHENIKNLTAKISKYFNTSLFPTIAHRWQNLNKRIEKIFIRNFNDKEDIPSLLSDFNRQVVNFEKYHPHENIVQLLHNFQKQMANALSDNKLKNQTLHKAFLKIKYFTTNVTDLLNRSLSINQTQIEANKTDLIQILSNRFNDFFNSFKEFFKHDDFDHYENFTVSYPNISFVRDTLPSDEVFYDYFYFTEHDYDSSDSPLSGCGDNQLDKCMDICSENNQTFYGCYLIKSFDKKKKKRVNCVCSDKETSCCT